VAELLAGKIAPGMVLRVDGGREVTVLRRYAPRKQGKGNPVVLIGFDVKTETGVAYGHVPDTYRFEVVNW
jgi:hypothetical protein